MENENISFNLDLNRHKPWIILPAVPHTAVCQRDVTPGAMGKSDVMSLGL